MPWRRPSPLSRPRPRPRCPALGTAGNARRLTANGDDAMRMTVLGGCGAWPAADRACSGYLVEEDGFRLLVDPGYATLPRLLRHIGADDVDAVFVSHGHPDHCADLNP